MSLSNIISLDNVSVCYRLASHRVSSLKEYAIHLVTGSLTYRKLWALSGVSFRSQVARLLESSGRNGSGKSTLLKVISGVLKPIEGKVSVNGRVAPILALGTGFDYELTGRENILLNALLLGHSSREVNERMGEIVEFSGLRDFVNSPVRNYSSGMVRGSASQSPPRGCPTCCFSTRFFRSAIRTSSSVATSASISFAPQAPPS